MMRRFSKSLLLSTVLLASVACKDPLAFEESITEPMVLGGVSVSAESLSNGRQMYVRQCMACHGLEGDGRGPSSPGLRPAPRDLREAKYKFIRMEDGDLPTDDMLYEIIRHGLHGTAMLSWDIQDDALYDIIHYIKSFSTEDEGWRDPENEVGTPLEMTEDPWTEKSDEGIARGKHVYHAVANCQSCHPAFATREYIQSSFVAENKKPEFRDDGYHSARQVTEYTVNGVEQTNLPPDYTWNSIRTVTPGPEAKVSLYRVIGAGVNGTAMARWKGTLDDDDLWAVSYYVESLLDMRDTPAAAELKAKLASQDEFIPPSAEPEKATDDHGNEAAEEG
jgi:mono/diheme cytochrome c family protein